MNDPAAEVPPGSTTILVGARWASSLGATLLAIFALVIVARFLQPPAAAVEEVVQTSLPTVAPTPTPTVLAPDPGDNP